MALTAERRGYLCELCQRPVPISRVCFVFDPPNSTCAKPHCEDCLYRAGINKLISQAQDLGWTVEFPDYCESAETPGMLGNIAGVCVHRRKAIKVRAAARTQRQIFEVLLHEIDHLIGKAVPYAPIGSDMICGGTTNAFGEA